MKIGLGINRQLDLERLHLSDEVFHPSFMTEKLTNSLNLTEDYDASILDLGTGSGVIAIALHLGQYHNICVSDRLRKTLDIASLNFKEYDFVPRAIFLSDMFENIPYKFDLIIANPPAYPQSMGLNRNEGIDTAVFSGYDGRKFIIQLISKASEHLTSKGRLVFAVPSFLDSEFVTKRIAANNFVFEELVTTNCELPTYGYPEKDFVENFRRVFNPEYYVKHGGQDQGHYWVNNESHKIEFRIHIFSCRRPSE